MRVCRGDRPPALGLLVAVLLGAVGTACGRDPSDATTAPQQLSAPWATSGEPTDLGEGFVVWESNRSGDWRIWLRSLDGGEPRQLAADERGRGHCCPHISPTGREVAFLSLEPGQKPYPLAGSLGQLRLVAVDGSGERLAAPAARTYYENRAVVWRSDEELIHIDAERYTVLLDLAGGASRRLTARPGAERGYLIDPGLRWAASGLEGFSAYDAERKVVAERTPLGGCQFYFTRDGGRGYWMAGAGGPIRWVDLAGGRSGTLLSKNDPRMGGDLGYLYFPMLSGDARLLAFAASAGGHSHFEADYEIFLAEVDPVRFELLGPPLRWTEDPATDRFPDVYRAPLPLGRHAGEAPYRLALEAGEGRWEWRWGDGSGSSGRRGEHIYRDPGRYRVEARSGDRLLRGEVVVSAARPPRPLEATAVGNGELLRVRFDEPIRTDGVRLELASGIAVELVGLDDDDRTLVARPERRLRDADRLQISGVTDDAQSPNPLPPVELEIAAPFWPADRDGLLFLWENGGAPNLIWDAEVGGDRAAVVEAHGRARYDRHLAMVPAGGFFRAADDLANRIRWACQGRNTVSLEALVVPDPDPRGAVGTIVALEGDLPNFRLAQRGDRLFFGVRVGGGPRAFRELELFALPAGRASHVAVTYTPGRLQAWLDGEPRIDSVEIQGDMFQWRTVPLLFGAGHGGRNPWAGTLEGVAIYDRPLDSGEAAENHLRHRARLAARTVVRQWIVEAALEGCAPEPELRRIAPYREALTVCSYRVERWVDGASAENRLRVAQWAILDAESLPPAGAAGGLVTLRLERFEDNPQLESLYLAELADSAAGPLYYSVSSESR